MYYVPGMITLGFIVIRLIIKFASGGEASSSTGPKEYIITSQLKVDSELIQKLQLRSSDQVSLYVMPGSNVVEVRVNRPEGFEKIGTIQDTELSMKTESGKAFARITSVYFDTVMLELVYR